jgi:hypothetical protein
MQKWTKKITRTHEKVREKRTKKKKNRREKRCCTVAE